MGAFEEELYELIRDRVEKENPRMPHSEVEIIVKDKMRYAARELFEKVKYELEYKEPKGYKRGKI